MTRTATARQRIADNLRELSNRMHAIAADLARDPSPHARARAIEMHGAAELALEWADGLLREPDPSQHAH